MKNSKQRKVPLPVDDKHLSDWLFDTLFSYGADPLFAKHGVPITLLDEFVSQADVRSVTEQYITRLSQLWLQHYPTRPPLVAANLDLAEALTLAPLPLLPLLPPAKERIVITKAPPTMPLLNLRLPNARTGQPYAETALVGQGEQAPPLLGAELPAGLGLAFDLTSGQVIGTPNAPGEYPITLYWADAQGQPQSSASTLIVNPDPRALWRDCEPPADALYPKPHVASAALTSPQGKVLAASRRGRSHAHVGSFREDDFWIAAIPETGWTLLLVADGAGSAQFSRHGSALVTATAGAHLKNKLQGELGHTLAAHLQPTDDAPAQMQTIGNQFHYLFHAAASLALSAVEREAQQHQAEVRDYATTLLAAAVFRQGDYCFIASCWIGDGAIAAYGPRGKVRLLGRPDSGEFAGQTRFLDRALLADQAFGRRIRIGRLTGIEAVLLLTDGVSDPYFETENGLKDPERWDRLWDEIGPLCTYPEADTVLAEWLDFFSSGNHDDRTLAVLRID